MNAVVIARGVMLSPETALNVSLTRCIFLSSMRLYQYVLFLGVEILKVETLKESDGDNLEMTS